MAQKDKTMFINFRYPGMFVPMIKSLEINSVEAGLEIAKSNAPLSAEGDSYFGFFISEKDNNKSQPEKLLQEYFVGEVFTLEKLKAKNQELSVQEREAEDDIYSKTISYMEAQQLNQVVRVRGGDWYQISDSNIVWDANYNQIYPVK